MSQARKLFEKLDNHHLDELFKIAVSSGILENLSVEGDFDFHSVSFLKILGLKRFLQIAQIVSEIELRNILSNN